MKHEDWMQQALIEARKAPAHGDVPIGAVAVYQNQVIGRGHNRREVDHDPTAHAEILALREAGEHLGSWRLDEVTLYCTLEPCPMCAGAMVQARLPLLIYAAHDAKAGASGSIVNLLDYPGMFHKVAVRSGILADEAAAELQQFFATLRTE
jgi:tRNA(adenine34) deaminase